MKRVFFIMSVAALAMQVACDMTKTSSIHSQPEAVVLNADDVPSKSLVDAGGGCPRGAMMLDAYHNTAGWTAKETKLHRKFFKGRAFVTQEEWSEEKLNAFQVFGYDSKGDRSLAKVPFMNMGSMTIPAYAGAKHDNTFSAGRKSIDDVVEELGLQLPANKQGFEEAKLSLVSSDGGKIFRDTGTNGFDDIAVDKNLMRAATAAGAVPVGVSPFTHLVVGHSSFGYGAFTIPLDVSDPAAPLSAGLKATAEEKDITIAVSSSGGKFPPNVKQAALTIDVTAWEVKKRGTAEAPRISPIRIADKGQKAVVIPGKLAAGLKPGTYLVTVAREYLYAPELDDEVKGNYCVLVSARGTAKLDIAAPAKK